MPQTMFYAMIEAYNSPRLDPSFIILTYLQVFDNNDVHWMWIWICYQAIITKIIEIMLMFGIQPKS
jgi:hypothetical protein